MGMSEQEKREKVIKGLECCISENTCKDEYYKKCPYLNTCYREAGPYQLMKDALELLKAQEPRVMTLDEIIAAAPGTVVWLEDYDKTDVIAGLVKKVYIYTKVIDFLIVNEKVNDEVTADLDTYSKGWRCWTSRPDDKQREAVKWE